MVAYASSPAALFVTRTPVWRREKKNKPLKNPLKELVVVHTDKDFLADIEGGSPPEPALHLLLHASSCYMRSWCSSIACCLVNLRATCDSFPQDT